MEEYFRDVEWNFINMNSPADLFCHYREDGTIYLEEYDRCRNGHLLLSSFFVNAGSCAFEAEVLEIQDGAGIGLYFGDGCFDRYIIAVAGEGSLEVRIPNGVPLGDTFRYDGPKRCYTAASVPFTAAPPFRLGFEMTDSGFSVLCDGSRVIENAAVSVPWKKPYARVMTIAVNDRGISPKCGTLLGKYRVQGVEEGERMAGICADREGRPLREVWLHTAGIQNHQGLTDETGRFDLGVLPPGEYEIIAGAEKLGFGHFTAVHTGSECRWCLDPYWQQDAREAVPQGELDNDSFLASLNGVWKFSMDSGEKGEEEKWFLPHNHLYEQRILIPGSWQSLRAFGEEFLADDDTLHQASSFRCNWREQGRTAWMQTEISVEHDIRAQLVFGAVSGIAKLWLDDKELGCTVDFYAPCRFRLGTLKAGRTYVLTVRIRYPFEGKQCCFGKQGFWFTDSPGIWQNVWMEEEKEARISEILIENYRKEDSGIIFRGKIEMELNPENMDEVECREWGDMCFLSWSPDEDTVYRVDFMYRAPEGYAEAKLLLDGRTLTVDFDATYEDAYDRRTVYVKGGGLDHKLLLKRTTGKLELGKVFAGKASLCYTARPNLETPPQGLEEIRNKVPELPQDTAQALQESPEAVLDNLEINARGVPEMQFEICGMGMKEWAPGTPDQYVLSVMLEDERGLMGTYKRRAAFRRTGQKRMPDGTVYVTINEDPVYLRGVLDQGYNPWGLYTYPSLEKDGPGSVAFDVKAAVECGYNMVRMHIKDNEPEWYSACDREGVLVWDEVPSCFYGTWEDTLWRGLHLRRMKAMVRKQNYHPSVVMCSVFNESWGILGDHERSPWTAGAAQEWIRASARYYKQMAPGVLVVDNSGYGKTGETDILDYHSYPLEFEDASDFFKRLEKQNYPGSVFNCYNEENRRLMQEDPVRDLLQRNCRNPLKETEFIGNDRQKGQPVIISEFVHTNEIERLVRICKFAGYVRMNLASQENEDTSPFSSKRVRRDFGLLHRDMTPAGYSQVNREAFIYLARPWLTAVRAGETLKVPVYAALHDLQGDKNREQDQGRRLLPPRVCWSLAGVDKLGRWKKDMAVGEVRMEIPCRASGKPGEIEVRIPDGIKGAWLFAWIEEEGTTLCEHDIQLEIMTEEDQSPEVFYWNPADTQSREFTGYTGRMDTDKRHLWWAAGSGYASWKLRIPKRHCGRKILRLELSSCECLEGTRMTDEKEYPSRVRIFVQGKLCEELVPPDQPWDKRALFSNGSAAENGAVSYRRTGKYGYGYRYDIPVEVDEETEVIIEAENGGCIIYGNRMGRYGCDPMLLTAKL